MIGDDDDNDDESDLTFPKFDKRKDKENSQFPTVDALDERL